MTPFTIEWTRRARRSMSEDLPEGVAAAAFEFIYGPLRDNPHRVGKRLAPPLGDRYSARRGTYRIIYKIDDEALVVTIVDVAHRGEVYHI